MPSEEAIQRNNIGVIRQIPIFYRVAENKSKDLRLLSLFSGCGGMDLGFEGNFVCHVKSINSQKGWIKRFIGEHWVELVPTRFNMVFANDILQEAKIAWVNYMERYGYSSSIYHSDSIVDLVKMHKAGANIFPDDIDIITGGFPCQDFSVSGKRLGFNSKKDHNGKIRSVDEPSEETRGKLYYWMKQVIDVVKPKIFIAENVKGLVNFGDVKDIIQKDFSQADDDGYIVLDPQILHAGNYGVPESRERVIFIGLRKSALKSNIRDMFLSGQIPKKYNPYPEPTHSCTVRGDGLLPIVTCGDVFRDLKEPSESNDLSQKMYSKAKYMGAHCQGQKEVNLDGIGPTIRSEHHGNIEYRRLSEEHGGVYVKELKKGLIERRLSPRECALIQTFPPDYPFVFDAKQSVCNLPLSASSAYKVIGNAVPPVLAYNIAMRIQELWDIYFD